MKFRAVAASFLVLAVASVAMASDDPIATRQNIMKSVGSATGAATKMIRGELPYDPVKAELAVRTIFTAATGFGDYFPEGSETGGKTTAAPKIWESREEFDALLAKFEADALAAIDPASQGVDTFRGAFQKVAQNCGSCHESFRVKR